MPKTNLKVIPGKAKSRIDDDIDGLFKVPLTEFISARQTLAARLKKEGRSQEANLVKALVKPSITAWTVNQLYWEHREPFEQLMATGERIRQSQATGRGGKGGNLRTVFDERREVLSQLSDLATTLLRDAGHNPALDTLRRIATTLEAMTAYSSLPAGLSPGRLVKDIDPPGFDSLASFAMAAGSSRHVAEPARVSSTIKSSTKTQQKSRSVAEAQRLKESRQKQLAAAKVSLQEAKKSLVAARASAKRLEAAQKKADGEAKEAEKHRREAERRFKDAGATCEAAIRRSKQITIEVERAKKTVEDADLAVANMSTELESLFRES
jgi:hypothetical protein